MERFKSQVTFYLFFIYFLFIFYLTFKINSLYYGYMIEMGLILKGEKMNDKKMKTTNIKGKEYVEVNARIKYLRENFKGYQLLSEIVRLDDGVCIIKARLINAEGVEVANGLAYEKEGSTFINKTSYIENCETSAWGRCLGNFGIGIDTSVASADEVQNAIKQQSQGTEKRSEKIEKEEKISQTEPNDENFRKQVTFIADSKDKQKVVVELLGFLNMNKLEEVRERRAFISTLESKLSKL